MTDRTADRTPGEQAALQQMLILLPLLATADLAPIVWHDRLRKELQSRWKGWKPTPAAEVGTHVVNDTR